MPAHIAERLPRNTNFHDGTFFLLTTDISTHSVRASAGMWKQWVHNAGVYDTRLNVCCYYRTRLAILRTFILH